MAIGGELVEYRIADGLQGLGELGHIGGLRLLHPLLGRADTGFQVGVANTEKRAVEHRPAAQQRVHPAQVDDQPVVRAVKGALRVGHGAVRLGDLDADRLGGDLAPLAVVLVLQRVVRVELEFIQGKAGGVIHGVGPGDILGEADADPGQALQRGPGHVVFAGNGEVGLVPAPAAVPGLVGVAQQQAAAVLGGVAADRQGVAAHLAGLDGAARGRQRAAGEGLDTQLFQRGQHIAIRSLHPQDAVADDALVGAARQADQPQVLEQVDLIDFVDPGCTAAAGLPLGQVVHAGFAQVAVHASGVAHGQVLGKLRQGVEEIGAVLVLAAVEVAVQLVPPHIPLLAHQLRRAPGGLGDFDHGDAVVVLGVGVAVTVAQAGPVVRLDMRYPVLGAAHLGGVGHRGFYRGFRFLLVIVVIGIIARRQQHTQGGADQQLPCNNHDQDSLQRFISFIERGRLLACRLELTS